jgi:hypothetical protein
VSKCQDGDDRTAQVGSRARTRSGSGPVVPAPCGTVARPGLRVVACPSTRPSGPGRASAGRTSGACGDGRSGANSRTPIRQGRRTAPRWGSWWNPPRHQPASCLAHLSRPAPFYTGKRRRNRTLARASRGGRAVRDSIDRSGPTMFTLSPSPGSCRARCSVISPSGLAPSPAGVLHTPPSGCNASAAGGRMVGPAPRGGFSWVVKEHRHSRRWEFDRRTMLQAPEGGCRRGACRPDLGRILAHCGARIRVLQHPI